MLSESANSFACSVGTLRVLSKSDLLPTSSLFTFSHAYLACGGTGRGRVRMIRGLGRTRYGGLHSTARLSTALPIAPHLIRSFEPSTVRGKNHNQRT